MSDDLCFVRSGSLGQPRGHEYDINAPDQCAWCALSHEATALRTQLDEAVRLLRRVRADLLAEFPDEVGQPGGDRIDVLFIDLTEYLLTLATIDKEAGT